MYAKLASRVYEVVVLSNTTLAPGHILEVVPEIQFRFPSVSIVVLSGYMEDDFASRLVSLGVHDVFKMPSEARDAARRILAILAEKNSPPPLAQP